MIPFSGLKYSTKTIIAVTNMNIKLDLFHQYIPYLNYSFPKKKRGRKKQDEEVVIVPNKLDYFPIGSIIALQNKQDLKGELPKKKQNDPQKKSFFRNSVTIQMKIDQGKFVNGKICSNGKFQITGCSEDRYAYEFIYILYEKMIESKHGKDFLWLLYPQDNALFDEFMQFKPDPKYLNLVFNNKKYLSHSV